MYVYNCEAGDTTYSGRPALQVPAMAFIAAHRLSGTEYARKFRIMSNGDIHPIDLHVGNRVRARRKSLNISQTELATGLGLTFQQVQKYERGLNRISASKLFEISRALKAPIAFFFEGYDGPAVGEAPETTSSEQAVSQFLATAEGLELAECFTRLPSPGLRRSLLDLARAMTADAA